LRGREGELEASCLEIIVQLFGSAQGRHRQAGLPRVIDTERLNRIAHVGLKIDRRFSRQPVTGHFLAIQEEDNLKIHDCLLLLPIVKDVECNGNKYCIAAAGFKAAPTS
jgi:hypothetical protein